MSLADYISLRLPTAKLIKSHWEGSVIILVAASTDTVRRNLPVNLSLHIADVRRSEHRHLFKFF